MTHFELFEQLRNNFLLDFSHLIQARINSVLVEYGEIKSPILSTCHKKN